jgi:uncharacterized protein YjbI with pentapeptide repeats
MANKQHVKLLKEGSKVWNAWREQYPHERPDLSQANLSLANLSDADLSDADLSWANLRGATLCRANLVEVNFSRANLSGARLSEATIGATIFAENDLSTTEELESVTHISPSTQSRTRHRRPAPWAICWLGLR